MGAEIQCNAKVGRRSASGRALLETGEIVFRSTDLRLTIPFSSITKLDAKDGELRIAHADETVVFLLGQKQAASWAEKIRNPKSLIDKLGIKPEHRVATLGVTDASFLRQLAGRAPDVSTRPRKQADVVIFQADSVLALTKLIQLQPKLKRNGMMWLITPKGRGGIAYAEMVAAAKSAQLVDVKISAYNATHTATKLVIPKALR